MYGDVSPIHGEVGRRLGDRSPGDRAHPAGAQPIASEREPDDSRCRSGGGGVKRRLLYCGHVLFADGGTTVF